MKRIERDHISYIFSRQAAPALFVDSGETVVFHTYDCFTNRFLKEGTTYENVPPCPGNPVSGPLFVEGAEPGDMLKVEICSIEPGPLGVVVVGPKSGCLKEYFPEREIRRVPVEHGRARFSDSISLRLAPMVGTIGTAPAGEEIPSVYPGIHGGNMDCTKIGEGAVLYLPVFVPGGLLSMGDVHALMGDGETEDCGLEIEAYVTVRVHVIKNTGIGWPIVETERSWIAIASEKTVDEAWRAADRQMFELLTKQAGIGAYDAGMLLTLAGDLAFCQTVNPLMTVRMEFPKEILEQYGFRKLREGENTMENVGLEARKHGK